MDFYDPKAWAFATQAIHAGFNNETHGAVIPPIYFTSTYAQKSPGIPMSHFEYSRTHNPTREALETTLAVLEKGNTALCFASGCAALSCLLQTLPAHSHVIISDDVYGGTLRLLSQVFNHFGITFTQCDLSDVHNIAASATPQTRLILLETPSNPLLKILDIVAIAQWKTQNLPQALLCVDNTFATPYLQNPLSLGADCVCHSTTKYIGGHSDVIGGALIVNEPTLAERLAFFQNAMGAIPSPMDCFLLTRSLKTLGVRMAAHCENALALAHFLETHPKIQQVIYPGLTSHPQHALATQQMRGYGGMISIVHKGTSTQAMSFLQKLRLFTLAESLGGVESLIGLPARMTHAGIPIAHREKIGISDTLIRLSVGIEAVRDLIADLTHALG